MAKASLFGYELNQTSGVLLFIFGILTIITGTSLLYTSFVTWSITETIPPAGIIISFAIIGFGFFILVAAIAARSKGSQKNKQPKKEKKNYLTVDGKKSPLSKKEIDRRRKLV